MWQGAESLKRGQERRCNLSCSGNSGYWGCQECGMSTKDTPGMELAWACKTNCMCFRWRVEMAIPKPFGTRKAWLSPRCWPLIDTVRLQFHFHLTAIIPRFFALVFDVTGGHRQETWVLKDTLDLQSIELFKEHETLKKRNCYGLTAMCLLYIKLTKGGLLIALVVNTSGKMELQLKNCLHETSLWAFLWDMFWKDGARVTGTSYCGQCNP